MMNGYLVYPDLSSRRIDFEIEHAQQFLGGVDTDRVSVAFQDDGSSYAALFNSAAAEDRAEPNPVASLGRNEHDTGNSAFFSDPTRAIQGPVIFVGAEGEDIGEDEIAKVDNGIRACRAYREDYPEEFGYWRAAVLNREQ